ncbi:MAG: DUF5683 domain-containing protein [Bacteroidia bacterium]
MKFSRILSFWVLMLAVFQAHAQQQDTAYIIGADSIKTAEMPYQHSVKRAVRYSMILPGLGQVYNRKYWKVPIIYGLGGFTVYTAVQSHRQYIDYRNAYRLRTDDDPSTVDDYVGIFNNPALRANRDDARQNRDLMIILTAGVYALNLIDATVDAHLFHFNVSDDLSVRLIPEPPYYHLASGQWQTPLATIRLKL